MKTKILALLFCLSTSLSFSQSPVFEWVKEVDIEDLGYSLSNCEVLKLDQQGNVFTTGSFVGIVDFDAGPAATNLNSNGVSAGYIQKLNADGELIWVIKIGSTGQSAPATSLSLDDAGNIYCTGYFTNTVDFDPSSAVEELTSFGGIDVFVLKLNPDGSFAWVKQFGGANSQLGNSIAVDSNGDVSVTGILEQTADFDPGVEVFNMTSTGFTDFFITKLDSNGDFIWSKQVGNTDPDSGIEGRVKHVLDSDGNILITGFFYQTIDFDPGPEVLNISAVGATNAFVLKLDLDGLLIWAKQIGFTDTFGGQMYGSSIAVDGSNNIYLTGQFAGSADMDPGPVLLQYVSTGYDTFVLKLNSEGNFVWVKSIVGNSTDAGVDIATTSNGDCYVTGYFEGTADFDSGPNTTSLMAAGSNSISDVYVLKLYSDGDFGWAIKIGSVFEDFGRSIDVDDNGNVYTYGVYHNNPLEFSYPEIDFDPGVGTYYLTSDSDFPQGYFIHKMSQCTPSVFSDVQVACDSFTWSNGVTYTAPNNSATQTLTNALGCDSIVNLFLTLNVSTSFTENQTACGEYSWPLTGATYTSSGTYTFEDTNAGGCPQTTTLNLIINSTTASESQTACDSYTWPLNGTTYTSSGSYTQVSTDGSDCEVTTTLNLTINTVDVSTSVSGSTITANASGADYQWINCNNGNSPISGATSQSYTATASGNYAVIVSEGNCSSTSNCVNIIVGGIDELMGSTIDIYPNPSNDAITITSSSIMNKISLINAMGQEVDVFESLSLKKYSIVLPNASGTYLVQIYTEEGLVNKLLVKE